MKTNLPFSLLFVSLFFIGCNKHQYVFLDSQEEPSATNEFVVANDSLEIRYDFSGENIPVKIRVENKSDKPVYIDWKKSAAIIDGKKYNYWNETSSIEISGYSDVFLSAGGEIVKDERITYIPARSYIETTRIFLQKAFFVDLAPKNLQMIKMLSEDSPVRVRRYTFSAENSPLTFRSILALSSQESFTNESFYENTFWISEILESPYKHLYPSQENRANGISSTYNSSVLSAVTNFGKAAGTVSLLGITAGAIILSAQEQGE